MKILHFLAVLTTDIVVCGAPSVWFARERGIGFALIRGAEVTGSDNVFHYSATSFCHCRRLCYVNPSCDGASYAETDTKQCRTIIGGFYHKPLEMRDNATLILMNTTRHWFHIGLDGRLYLVMGWTHNLRNAADVCNSIPGFHLGIYKDVRSTEALQEIHESLGYDNVAVGMSYTNSLAYWSDNTPFEKQIYDIDTSGKGYYFMLQSKKFEKVGGDTSVYVVCQADLQNGKH